MMKFLSLFSSDVNLGKRYLWFGLTALLLPLVFLSPETGKAQELYYTVSGQGVEVKSGDQRSEYEYWIIPGDNAGPVTLQIFDAGVGGVSDVIPPDTARTITTYELYPFNSKYSYENNDLTEISGDPTSLLTTMTAGPQNRFKDRWIDYQQLEPGKMGNGYLLKTSAGKGVDVNTFKLRLVDEEGRK